MEKQQKVVIIGTAFPLRGGLSAYNERIARAFSANNYDASIITFKLQYPEFLFPGKTQYSTEPKPEDLNIKVWINSINPFNWIKVGLRIKKMKPDLVIIKFWLPFMAPCLGTIARIIRKNKHTKIISIADNIIPHEKRAFDNILVRYFIKSVDGFIVMSKSVLNDLDLFDKNIPRLFNPHPLYDNYGDIISKQEAKQRLKLDQNTNYLLFFGFIRDYKGLDLLLNAIADPRLIDSNIKLLVAGEFYNDPKPYFELIDTLHLKDKVIMSNDFIADSQVGQYFCAADLIVQPYKHATQSGVTQIAYNFEKPMIVTDVGGLKEIVPDNKVGYVVEPTAKNIADAIIKFYSHNNNDIFLDYIKEEKKKYSWELLIDNIQKLSTMKQLTVKSNTN